MTAPIHRPTLALQTGKGTRSTNNSRAADTEPTDKDDTALHPTTASLPTTAACVACITVLALHFACVRLRLLSFFRSPPAFARRIFRSAKKGQSREPPQHFSIIPTIATVPPVPLLFLCLPPCPLPLLSNSPALLFRIFVFVVVVVVAYFFVSQRCALLINGLMAMVRSPTWNER